MVTLLLQWYDSYVYELTAVEVRVVAYDTGYDYAVDELGRWRWRWFGSVYVDEELSCVVVDVGLCLARGW